MNATLFCCCVVISFGSIAAIGCIIDEVSTISVVQGGSAELLCSSLTSGSTWVGNNANDIQCTENSHSKKCTINNIGTQFKVDSFEMVLFLSNGTCTKKCTFHFNIIHSEYITVSSTVINSLPITNTIITTIHDVIYTSTSDLSSSIMLLNTTIGSVSNYNATPIIVAVVIIIIIIIIIVLLVGSILVYIKLKVFKNETKDSIIQNIPDDNGFCIGSETNDLFKERKSISFCDVIVEDLVRKGTFILTHHAVISNHGDVTVKRLKANVPQDNWNELKHEIEVFKKVTLIDNNPRHNTIPLLISIIQEPLCLILERLPSLNLKQFLISLLKGPAPEWYIQKLQDNNNLAETQIPHHLMSILIQIAEGQKYLCDNDIIHCCLSSQNVLIGKDLVVKLIDFLPSANGNYYIETDRGEYPENMSPESIKDGIHTSESVIWSFGIIMFRLATFDSINPFNKTTPNQLYMQIENGMRPLAYPTHSKEYYRQIQECLQFQPKDRPHFDQVLHTLVILHENSSQHLIINISTKKRGYIDETGNVFLSSFKQKKRLLSLGVLQNRKLSTTTDDDDYSTTESGVELTQKNNKRKLTKKISSLIKQTKPSSIDTSKLSQFEHVQLIEHGEEYERHNPLATIVN